MGFWVLGVGFWAKEGWLLSGSTYFPQISAEEWQIWQTIHQARICETISAGLREKNALKHPYQSFGLVFGINFHQHNQGKSSLMSA
ncbi:MAG: hypothetical protein IT259_18380 [Saprospiraceae bacterium]|nr:hypothetical protein [Saprospiraceae bacterium]